MRRYLKSKYGDEAIYNNGLTVYTTVNSKLQEKAQYAVKNGILELDKRQGYRGAKRHLKYDEIEEFIQTVKDDTSIYDLFDGRVYIDLAVVTNVDDKEKKISIQLGRYKGTIELEDFKWARKPDAEIPYFASEAVVKAPSEVFKVGDVIDVKVISKAKSAEDNKKKKEEAKLYTFSLYQDPIGQAALISMDVHSGFVTAMVGGYDFQNSEFNRAVQAKRLPGSAFKPIIYAAAIDHEPKNGKYYTPATVIYDTAFVFEDGKWKPSNYSNEFKGAISLRKALAKSVNIPAVKVLSDIGVNYVSEYAKKLGIDAYINPDPTAALGSSAMTLFELTNAYAIFASGGLKIEPVFVTKVVDSLGNVLEEYAPPSYNVKEEEVQKAKEEADKTDNNEEEPKDKETPEKEKAYDDPRRVIDKGTAYVMTSLLQSVVEEGTAWRIKKAFPNIPLAGKTGTTNDFIDAWYIGYSPDIVTGVWIGLDEEKSIGKAETGSRAASPIWVEYMSAALKDRPVKNFSAPEDVEFIKIDPLTGLLAKPDTENAKFECFKKGTVPTEYTTTTQDKSKTDDFFINDLEEEENKVQAPVKEIESGIEDSSSSDNIEAGEEEEAVPVVIP